MNQQFIKAVY